MTDIEILESLKAYTCKPEVVDEAIRSIKAMRNITDVVDGKHPLIVYIQEDVRYKIIEEIVRGWKGEV